MQKIRTLCWPSRLPLLKNLQHIGVAARNADRGKARSIHVLDQGAAAGLQLFRRHFGKFRGNRASGWDVAADHARGPSAGIAHNRPFDEALRVRRIRFNPQSLQGAAVQKNLIVRFLQRHRIVRRDLIQLLARKRFWIVRELLMGPAADVVDPFARPRRIRPGAQHLDGLFSRVHSIETELPCPRGGRAQKMHMVIDEPGRDGLTQQVDPASVRTRKLSHGLVGAHRHDAIAFDSHRLCDSKALIDGNNFPVREDQIRRRLLRPQYPCDRKQNNNPSRLERGAFEYLVDYGAARR